MDGVRPNKTHHLYFCYINIIVIVVMIYFVSIRTQYTALHTYYYSYALQRTYINCNEVVNAIYTYDMRFFPTVDVAGIDDNPVINVLLSKN